LNLFLFITDDEIELPVWDVDDLGTLIANIEKETPKSDMAKFSTTLEKINWQNVQFGTHSAVECKAQAWSLLQKVIVFLCFFLNILILMSLKLITYCCGQVRRFRTLSEVLVDAKAIAKNPHRSLKTGR